MSFADDMRKFKRGPQIITPKDAAVIIAETGLTPDWKCLDLGGGSGFLSLFLANLVPNGKVTTYEIRKEHAEIIKENIMRSGLKNIRVVNKDAADFTGKNFDLITIDMKGAEGLVGKCFSALKEGGWICVYSPHMEQQVSCRKEMEKAGFHRIKTVENILREWKSIEGYTHPISSQVVHTGFLTFARKGQKNERKRV